MTTIPPQDISLETSLLKIMSINSNFNLYMAFVDKKRLLPSTSLLLDDYDKYFKLFPDHENIDFGQFQTQFTQNWHNNDLSLFDIEYYRDYVFPAIEKECSSADINQCLLGLIRKQTILQLTESANKKFDPETLHEILKNYEEKQDSLFFSNGDEEAITASNVDIEVLDKTKGISFFLPSLQEALGGIIQGQFILVSADSNTGKSAFVISQAAKALSQQLSGPILYFNSEGTPGDVFLRIWSNLYRDEITEGTEAIVRNRKNVLCKFSSTYDPSKFIVFQLNNKNLSDVVLKLSKYKPSLVIIDMLDSLADEEDPITLKKVYDKIRSLALQYCPIIGTTQSGNTEYFDKETGKFTTKKFLTDKDVLGCKAKSAAAETVITIGKDPNNPSLRFINVPKTKRGKQIKLTCDIYEQYSLYKEITF